MPNILRCCGEENAITEYVPRNIFGFLRAYVTHIIVKSSRSCPWW